MRQTFRAISNALAVIKLVIVIMVLLVGTVIGYLFGAFTGGIIGLFVSYLLCTLLFGFPVLACWPLLPRVGCKAVLMPGHPADLLRPIAIGRR